MGRRGTSKKTTQNNKISEEDSDALITSQLESFASSLRQQIIEINKVNESRYFTPQVGQDFTQSVNLSPNIPTQKQLTEWLKQPHKNQKALRDTSVFLDNAIMQYQRSVKHLASIMTFRYDLRPQDRKPKDSTDAWLSSMDTCYDVLKKLNIKYQFEKVNWGIFETGAKFYYLRETDRFSTLQELPIDYCYITGYWDLGYTFAIDLTFFDKIVNARFFAPEFYDYYETFIKMRELGLSGSELAPYQYYPVPVEKGWVFVFDPIHAQATPPLKGVFKDALEILSYKDLLKQKTALDTWKLVAQKIPYDKDSKKFIVDYNQASAIVNVIQQLMPSGVRTFATMFEPQEINFNQSQSMNNITGLGEQLYWRSIGISGVMMGEDANSALTLKYSLEGDYAYVEHLYRQYENFVNWHLMLNSRTYSWKVKFYGNRYTEAEDIDRELKILTTSNAGIEKLYALRGYEPFEIDPMLDLEETLDRKSRMKPIISGNQMSGKVGSDNGAPTKSDSEITDSGAITRDHDSNANAMR